MIKNMELSKKHLLRLIKIKIAFIALLLMVGTSDTRAADDAPAGLSDYVAEALANNPRIRAAEQHYQAMTETVPQAGALPDPQLKLGVANLPVNSFAFNQEPMTGKVVSIMQMFPFPGKLGLASDIAELNSSVAEYQKKELKNPHVYILFNM